MKKIIGGREYETPFEYKENGFFYDATGYAFANVRQTGDYNALGQFIADALNAYEQGWRKIESEEDLPKEHGSYLITVFDQSTKRNQTYTAMFRNNLFWIRSSPLGWKGEIKYWTVDAIAWRPLPAPFGE